MNVRTLCLGILWFGDVSGYEINKLAAEGRFSHFIEASYGSIYPALKRLMQDGHVTRRQEMAPGRPGRHVYSITEAGREALLATLAEGAGPDVFKSEFLFLCLYAEKLDAAAVRRAVDRQLDHLRQGVERLKSASERCDHPASRFAIDYGIALHEAAIAYLGNNRRRIEIGAEAERPQAAE